MKVSEIPIDASKLASLLLDESWHENCEIIPDYMPKYPSKDTRPTVQVRFNDGSKYPPMLRYSKGPKQGFFWDIYGEDMQTVELAIVALSQAPTPRDVGPITFTIPLPSFCKPDRKVAKDFACPRCQVASGETCIDDGTLHGRQWHVSRQSLADESNLNSTEGKQ